MSRFTKGAAVLLLLAIMGTLQVRSVMAGQGISVACVAGTAKMQMPAGLCAMFVDQVRAAFPDEKVLLSTDLAGAGLTLQVLRAGSSTFSARLDWGQGAGRMESPALATAIKGRDLRLADIGEVTAKLLENTPRP